MEILAYNYFDRSTSIRLLILLHLIILSSNVFANNDYFCLVDNKKEVVLLVSTNYPSISSVTYYPYLKNIKISKPIHEEQIDMGDNEKPEVYRTMNEIYQGKITGKYIFMSQGYLLYEVTYLNFKTKKKTVFSRESSNLESVNCL